MPRSYPQNNLTSAYIRPLVFVGDVGMGVNPPAGYSTDVIIAAFPWGAYLGAEALDQGSMRWFLPGTVSRPIPSRPRQSRGNYLSSLLVGSEARRHGYQEGIALDVNGYISEGAGENLFEVKDGVLFTPPFTSSALPGITRDAIIKLAKIWILKSASRCCPVNLCIWLMKSLCLVLLRKSLRCAALTVFRLAKVAAARSPSVFSKLSLVSSPVKPRINGAGWIRLTNKHTRHISSISIKMGWHAAPHVTETGSN
ncbi:hypothetical protein DMH27_15355 [Raoultella planticola]|nr:hypothetical protein [Raoultella planticola]